MDGWFQHEGFKELIQEKWKSLAVASNGDDLRRKLLVLKDFLIKLNNELLGDIDRCISSLEERLNEIKDRGDCGTLNEAELDEKKSVQQELWSKLNQREFLWKQKSRVLCSKEGDRNTTYFHRVARFKAKRKFFAGLLVDGEWIPTPGSLEKNVFSYFRSRFKVKEKDLGAKLAANYFKKLSDMEAKNMVRQFSLEEVKEAVWCCESSKALGPDGYNLEFFRKGWNFLKDDLLKFVEDFYSSGRLGDGINSSFIALIPKSKNLEVFRNYRSICLVSSLYKIIANLLAKRLSAVMSSIISDTQSALLSGRQFFDGMLVANEVIHSAKKSNLKKGMVILRFNFERACDSVNWNFLLHVMSQMGFDQMWIEWVRECISSPRVSVLVNGSRTKQFRMDKGLRQGDPISPLLLLMVVEALHMVLVKAEQLGMIRGVKWGNGELLITHLQFAEDTLIFLEADAEVVRNMKRILMIYQLVSGLRINFDKSRIFSLGVKEEESDAFADIMRFQKGVLPFNYLGIPLGINPKRKQVWKPMIVKFSKKLSVWKSKNLSFGARLTMVNSVLSALPMYYMAVFPVPKSVLAKFDSIIRRFLWGGDESRRKIAKVKWSMVCALRKRRGVDVVNLKSKNLASLANWLWRFTIEPDSLWRKIISVKYGAQVQHWSPNVENMLAVWKGILKIQNHPIAGGLIGPKECRWHVGDGKNTLFWWDRWLDEGTLKDVFPRLFLLANDKFAKVADYAIGNSFEHQSWTTFFRRNLLVWELNLLCSLCARLRNINLSGYKVDKILWEHEANGKFSVQKASELLCQMNGIDNFELGGLCKMKIPPKVQCFLWMLIMDRVPTKTFLHKRVVSLTYEQCLCPWCKLCMEDLSHVLYECSWARLFWEGFFGWWSFYICWPKSIMSFCAICFESLLPKQLNRLWYIAFAAAMWTLWLARDQKVSSDTLLSIDEMLFTVKVRSMYWIKAAKLNCLIDEVCWWNEPIASCVGRNLSFDKLRVRRSLRLENYVKFNINASCEEGICKAGCGGVLSTFRGEILAIFSAPIDFSEVDLAELLAVKMALDFFAGSKWKGTALIMESDSLFAVACCSKMDFHPRNSRNLGDSIDALVREIGVVSFVHVPSRDGNSMAESLAKSGLGRANPCFICW